MATSHRRRTERLTVSLPRHYVLVPVRAGSALAMDGVGGDGKHGKRRRNPRGGSGPATTLAVVGVVGVGGYLLLTRTPVGQQATSAISRAAGDATGRAVQTALTTAESQVTGAISAAATTATGGLRATIGQWFPASGSGANPNTWTNPNPGALAGDLNTGPGIPPGQPNADPSADTRQPNALESAVSVPPGGSWPSELDLRHFGGPTGYWYNQFSHVLYYGYKPNEVVVTTLQKPARLAWWDIDVQPWIEDAVQYALFDRDARYLATHPNYQFHEPGEQATEAITNLDRWGAPGFFLDNTTGDVVTYNEGLIVAYGATDARSAATLASNWFNSGT